MEQHSSECVGHEPCPQCGSKDNLARYSDGHAYCFGMGCNYFEPSADQPAEHRGNSTVPDAEFLAGDYRPLSKRGITEETCRKYGYRIAKHNGKTVHVCDIRNADRKLVAQNIRGVGKQFSFIGSIKDKPLIGMHLFSGGKKIVITEGAMDMLSYSQVQGNKWPVVSIPNGVKAAKKVIAANLDYLSNFEEILLSFDMDEPGQQAAKECAQLLIDRRVKLIQLPLKDANECLLAGMTQEMIQAIWNAKPYRPEGLLTLADLKDEIVKPVEWGLPWFLPTLTDYTYGRRWGELYFLGAGTGMGKTDWFTQSMAYDVKELKQPIGVFYLEMPPVEAGKRIAGKFAQKCFHVPDAGWTQEELKEAISHSTINDSVTLFDSFGCTDWDVIKEKIIYLQALGVRIFYIDHLTALATGEDKDEKTELEAITADMAKLSRRYGLILHVISHLATPEKGSHEEGARVTIRQFKGSRAIGFWAHFMFGMERNQQAEDEEQRTTTTFRILKDRYTGRSAGKTIPLGYEESTGMLFEKELTPDYGFQTEGTTEVFAEGF